MADLPENTKKPGADTTTERKAAGEKPHEPSHSEVTKTREKEGNRPVKAMEPKGEVKLPDCAFVTDPKKEHQPGGSKDGKVSGKDSENPDEKGNDKADGKADSKADGKSRNGEASPKGDNREVPFELIRRHPEYMRAYAPGTHELKQLLTQSAEDLLKRGYDPKGHEMGIGPKPGDPASAFVDKSKLWRPDPNFQLPENIRNQVQAARAAQKQAEAEQAKYNDPFGVKAQMEKEKQADAREHDPFHVAHLSDPKILEQNRKDSIAYQLANATPQQRKEYEQLQKIEKALERDPDMLEAQTLVALLKRDPETGRVKLTEEQRKNLADQVELQKSQRIARGAASGILAFEELHQRKGWVPDSPKYGKDNAGFIRDVDDNLKHASNADIIRGLETVEVERKLNAITAAKNEDKVKQEERVKKDEDLAKLQTKFRSELVTRVRSDVSDLEIAIVDQEAKDGWVSRRMNEIGWHLGGIGGSVADPNATPQAARAELTRADKASADLQKDFEKGSHTEFMQAWNKQTGEMAQALLSASEHLLQTASVRRNRVEAVSQATELTALTAATIAAYAFAPATEGGSVAVLPTVGPMVAAALGKVAPKLLENFTAENPEPYNPAMDILISGLTSAPYMPGSLIAERIAAKEIEQLVAKKALSEGAKQLAVQETKTAAEKLASQSIMRRAGNFVGEAITKAPEHMFMATADGATSAGLTAYIESGGDLEQTAEAAKVGAKVGAGMGPGAIPVIKAVTGTAGKLFTKTETTALKSMKDIAAEEAARTAKPEIKATPRHDPADYAHRPNYSTGGAGERPQPSFSGEEPRYLQEPPGNRDAHEPDHEPAPSTPLAGDQSGRIGPRINYMRPTPGDENGGEGWTMHGQPGRGEPNVASENSGSETNLRNASAAGIMGDKARGMTPSEHSPEGIQAKPNPTYEELSPAQRACLDSSTTQKNYKALAENGVGWTAGDVEKAVILSGGQFEKLNLADRNLLMRSNLEQIQAVAQSPQPSAGRSFAMLAKEAPDRLADAAKIACMSGFKPGQQKALLAIDPASLDRLTTSKSPVSAANKFLTMKDKFAKTLPIDATDPAQVISRDRTLAIIASNPEFSRLTDDHLRKLVPLGHSQVQRLANYTEPYEAVKKLIAVQAKLDQAVPLSADADVAARSVRDRAMVTIATSQTPLDKAVETFNKLAPTTGHVSPSSAATDEAIMPHTPHAAGSAPHGIHRRGSSSTKTDADTKPKTKGSESGSKKSKEAEPKEDPRLKDPNFAKAVAALQTDEPKKVSMAKDNMFQDLVSKLGPAGAKAEVADIFDRAQTYVYKKDKRTVDQALEPYLKSKKAAPDPSKRTAVKEVPVKESQAKEARAKKAPIKEAPVKETPSVEPTTDNLTEWMAKKSKPFQDVMAQTYIGSKDYESDFKAFSDYVAAKQLRITDDKFEAEMDAFTAYRKQREKDWEANKPQILPAGSDGNIVRLDPNHHKDAPDIMKELDQIKEKDETEKSAPAQDKAEESKPKEKPASSDSDVRTEEFPALQLVKQALARQNDQKIPAEQELSMKEQMLKVHTENMRVLREARKKFDAAEKEVRAFDPDKTPYVLNHRAIPEELRAKIDAANDKLSEVRKELREAEGKQERSKNDLVTHDLLERASTYVSKNMEDYKPRLAKTNIEKDYQKVSDDEGIKLIRQYDESKSASIDAGEKLRFAQSERYGLTLDDADTTNIDKTIKQLEHTAQETKDRLKETEDKMETLSPEDLLRFSSLALKEKQEVFRKAEEKYLNYITNHPQLRGIGLEEFKKILKKQMKMDGNVSEDSLTEPSQLKPLNEGLQRAQKELAAATSRHLKLRIENTLGNQDSPQFVQARERLIGLTEEARSSGDFKTESDAMNHIIWSMRQEYRQVRALGQNDISSSITGLKHNYEATADFADRPSQTKNIASLSANEYWRYRGPIDTGFESDYRMSGRVIAHPELIKEMDELASKYGFRYKVPGSEESWNRADPLTIYLPRALAPNEIREIAVTIEPFVYQGDENILFGNSLVDGTGKTIPGVRYDKTPSLDEVGDLIARGYEVSPELGMAIKNRFDIKAFDGSAEYGASPGMYESAKNFIEKLLKQ